MNENGFDRVHLWKPWCIGFGIFRNPEFLIVFAPVCACSGLDAGTRPKRNDAGNSTLHRRWRPPFDPHYYWLGSMCLETLAPVRRRARVAPPPLPIQADSGFRNKINFFVRRELPAVIFQRRKFPSRNRLGRRSPLARQTWLVHGGNGAHFFALITSVTIL